MRYEVTALDEAGYHRLQRSLDLRNITPVVDDPAHNRIVFEGNEQTEKELRTLNFVPKRQQISATVSKLSA
jgi:hypothetical protein